MATMLVRGITRNLMVAMALIKALQAEELDWAVRYEDGSRIEGRLKNVTTLTHADDRAEIEKKGRVFQRPASWLRQTGLRPFDPPRWIGFANGDRLPALLRSYEPADPHEGLPNRLVLDPGVIQVGREGKRDLGVWHDQVVRIVGEPEDAPALGPGALVLDGGQTMIPRAMRWRSDNLRVLAADGIQTVPIASLRSWRAAKPDTMVAVLRDVASVAPNHRLMRIETVDGAVITCAENRVREIDDGRFLAHPLWSIHALQIRVPDIAHVTYLRPGEVPLVALPAATLHERGFTGFTWRWRAGRNVRGGFLRVGDERSAIGIGSHSDSAIAFDLPAGAERFTAWVGLDAMVGRGGCAKVSLHRDELDTKPLWESGFLRGGGEPVRIDVGVSGAERLILKTDRAHEGRPPGADPFDIRDMVDWLEPRVRLRGTPEAQPQPMSVLSGWSIEPADRVEFVQSWSNRREGWWPALRTRGKEPVRLTRTVRIDYENARLALGFARDRADRPGHGAQVLANGEKVGAALNGDPRTNEAAEDQLSQRVYWLSRLVGQEVELTIELLPYGDGESAGLFLAPLALGPLVENLADPASLPVPDVLLTDLKPTETELSAEGRIAPGTCANAKELAPHGLRLEQGFALRAGSRVSYALDPSHRRFVAVLGLADGWQENGYAIDLDGEPFWEKCCFGRGQALHQLDIEIPAGHQTMTLRVEKGESFGAWGNAGFVTQ